MADVKDLKAKPFDHARYEAALEDLRKGGSDEPGLPDLPESGEDVVAEFRKK